MKIQLERPIVFFDLETTGTNILSDRIVQISLVKLHIDGSNETHDWYINPQRPITNSHIHGVTDEMVEDAPTFKLVAQEVKDFIAGCDIGGFNILKFDLPFLYEEMANNGYYFDLAEMNIIDVFKIYQLLRPRNLAACIKEFTGKELDGAHNALNDTLGTIDAWQGMIEKNEIEPSVVANQKMFINRDTMVDFNGSFVYDNNGDIVFSFGKHKGKIAFEQKDYLTWMMQSDFTAHTKFWAKKIYNEQVFYSKATTKTYETPTTPNTDDDLPF